MNPILSSGGGFGATLGIDGAFGAQNANQSRMALANGVTGNESQGEIAGIAQADKATTLKSAAGSIGSDYGYAWDEQSKRMQKKNVEQARRLQGISFMA